jgi:nitrate reductase gamma subunit
MAEGVGAEAGSRPSGGKADQSVAALLATLASEMRLLLRQEMALLAAELAEARDRLGRGAALVALGALALTGGFFALLAAAALALRIFLSPPLAALLVAFLSLAVGGVLLFFGKRALAARSLMPQRTLASLRADDAFLREEFR